MLDGQLVVQIPAGTLGIIFLIGAYFITNRLDRGILGAVNLEAACIKHGKGLCLGIAGGFQIIHDSFGQGVHKIRINSGFPCLFVNGLNAGIDIVRQRFVEFGLADISLLQHVVEHLFPTFRIFFRMGNRVITGGVLGDSGNDGAFGKVQFIYIFPEIPFGSSLYTQGVLP